MQVIVGYFEFVGLVKLEVERIRRICEGDAKVLEKPKEIKERVDALKKLCDQWKE